MGTSKTDPATIATILKNQPKPPPRGGLRIFLAYADGVGTTHAMLEAAHQRNSEGMDVVVASLDISDPKTAEQSLDNLDIAPTRIFEHNGKKVEDFDIDALIQRHPQLVLVENMAGSNSPHSRHPRRYQDIEELLAHGIDVYTTLNVYNISSLTDIIFQKTGIAFAETIPDGVLGNNTEIELVDLPVEELLQRFKQGKFHTSFTDPPPAELFYRRETLTPLRQLALHVAARYAAAPDKYNNSDVTTSSQAGTERLMVCISSHPLAERLVRTAYRLSVDLNADWFVVYIQTPDRLSYSRPHSERIIRTMRLAEELGSRVATITGANVAATALEFARKNAVSKIIVGKPLRPRWQEILGGSIVDEIIRHSGTIDVYVVSDKSGPLQQEILFNLKPKSSWQRYLLGFLLVCVVTMVCFPLYDLIEPPNLVMPYLLAVTLAAFYLGRGPSMLSSLLGALAFDFFFTHPRYSLTVDDTQYVITFFGLIGVSLLVSSLASTIREQVETSRQSEARASTLYTLSRDLTRSLDFQAMLNTIIQHIGQTFSREVVILLPSHNGLEVQAASPGLEFEQGEMDIAAWAFRHGQPAGRGTENMPGAQARYQPLKTAEGVIGILGVKPSEPSAYLNPEQRQLLEAYASLAALAIERAILVEQANQAHILGEGEKLQSALLNSISHDLRTPLASITGVFSSLHEVETEESGVVMDKPTRLDLIDNGWQEAERLNRLVGNLLDMTRLESGAIRLNREDCDIEDIIGAALTRLKHRLQDYTIKTKIPSQHPSVRADFVLIEQVLVNLLDNAAKYSETNSLIEIVVWADPSYLEVSVVDHGLGIPTADLDHVFEKFYRVKRRDKISGTGLGLSICKGIIDAHGGRIWAENRPEGGAALSFTLPTAVQRGIKDE